MILRVDGRKRTGTECTEVVGQNERFAVKTTATYVYALLVLWRNYELYHTHGVGSPRPCSMRWRMAFFSRTASLRTVEHGTVGFRYGPRLSTHNTIILPRIRMAYIWLDFRVVESREVNVRHVNKITKKSNSFFVHVPGVRVMFIILPRYTYISSRDVVSSYTSTDAPSRKGCVVNGRMIKNATNKYALPLSQCALT